MCWWWRHAWSPWEILEQGTLGETPSYLERSAGVSESRRVGRWLYQQRRCTRCGLTQSRLDKVRG